MKPRLCPDSSSSRKGEHSNTFWNHSLHVVGTHIVAAEPLRGPNTTSPTSRRQSPDDTAGIGLSHWLVRRPAKTEHRRTSDYRIRPCTRSRISGATSRRLRSQITTMRRHRPTRESCLQHGPGKGFPQLSSPVISLDMVGLKRSTHRECFDLVGREAGATHCACPRVDLGTSLWSILVPRTVEVHWTDARFPNPRLSRVAFPDVCVMRAMGFPSVR
jgi:hypothetical protein